MSHPDRPTRRTFLIDRQFQLKYAGLLLFAGVLIALGFAVMTSLVYSARQQTAALINSAPLPPVDSLSIVMLVFAVALAGVAMGLLGLVVTHRIAGPVFVMTHYVTALAKGSFPPIRALRRNDELKGFFERFQTALETLKAREAEEAQALSEALAALGALAQTPASKAALERLAALHDRKRAAVNSPATPIGSA